MSSDGSLVSACSRGDFTTAVAAIVAGASVNAPGKGVNGEVQAPLKAAVQQGHLGLVLHLLAAGADPNAGALLSTALLWTTSRPIVQALIDAGADVNGCSADSSRWRPIFAAVQVGWVDAVSVLLAEPTLDLAATNSSNQTPEQYAVTMKFPDIGDMIRAEVRP